MPDLSPDEKLREEQAREYGQYVANKAIDILGARAFNEGDPVPASHIERGVVSKNDVTKTKSTPTAPTGSEA